MARSAGKSAIVRGMGWPYSKKHDHSHDNHGLPACQKCRYYAYMSVTAEKVAEVLALSDQDRAYLARRLIASLDSTVDADAETKWEQVIARRSREIETGQVECRPVEDTVREIRSKLHARRQPS
jgi:hypothetical protein